MVLFPLMLCSKAYVYKPYLDPLQLGWDRGPQLSNCAENFCQIILDQCLDFFSSQEMSTRVYFRFSGAFAFPRLVSSWLGKSPAPFKFGMWSRKFFDVSGISSNLVRGYLKRLTQTCRIFLVSTANKEVTKEREFDGTGECRLTETTLCAIWF